MPTTYRRQYTSFEEYAAAIGVPLCGRACWMNGLKSHTLGYAEMGVVHWKPRSPVRRGIFNFLKLAARVKLGSHNMRPAERIWVEATYAMDLGAELGFRFPRSFADDDRARVRAELARNPGQVGPDLREKIIRWTRDQ